MISDGVTALLRLTNALLLLAFIVNLLVLRFRAGRTSAFFLPWLLFWTTFLAVNLAVLVVFRSPALEAPITIFGALSILNSLFLFLASEYLGSGQNPKRSRTGLRLLIKWAVPCVIALVALPAMSSTLQEFVPGALSFLALAIYAGRYGEVATRSSGWVSVLLYVYAGTNLVYFSRAGDPTLILALWVVSIPLKIVLYYTGYVEFSQSRRGATSAVSSPSARATPVPPKPPAVLPPVPEVTVEFTGFWGFLYILWRYPSGKAVVVFILASLLAALGFVASNLQVLLKSLAEGITR